MTMELGLFLRIPLTPITVIMAMAILITVTPLTDIHTITGGTTRTRGYFTRRSISGFTGIASETGMTGFTASTGFMVAEASLFKAEVVSQGVRPGHPLQADLPTGVLLGLVLGDVPFLLAAPAPGDSLEDREDLPDASAAVLPVTRVALVDTAVVAALVDTAAATGNAVQLPAKELARSASPA